MLAALAPSAGSAGARAQALPRPWSFAGGDLHNQGGVTSSPRAQQLDPGSGPLRWSSDSGATVESAPAIFNGWVYWGRGYRRNGVADGTLFALAPQ